MATKLNILNVSAYSYEDLATEYCGEVVFGKFEEWARERFDDIAEMGG